MIDCRVLTLLCLALSPALPRAQGDILYYKFDEAGGSKVINFAPAGSLAPEEGTITTNDVNGFVPVGRFASALKGGGAGINTFVESGWNGAFTGDFSVAFFVRHRNAPTSATYLFGNSVGLGFRAFTGGAAGRGLRVTNWGGTPLNLDTTRDLQTMVTTGWVHVALVVDTSRATATYYFDGVAEPSIPIGSGATVPAGPGFRVGAQLTPGSTWDMDEFRLQNRAATPNEIQIWSRRSSGADSPFGNGCGATLASSLGAPVLGNANYTLKLGAAASQPYALALGFSRNDYLGIPLPIDLGPIFPALSGCLWHTSIVVAIPSATNSGGGDALPFPIPNDPTLEAVQLFSQALVLRSGGEQTSNALAISVGY